MSQLLELYTSVAQVLRSGLKTLVPTQRQSLRVSYVGPSGIGKTSSQAAMCGCMEEVVATSDLQLTCRPEDSFRVSEAINSLRRLFLNTGLWVDPASGVPATRDPSEFRFWLGRRARRSDLMIQFCDFPGEWMGPTATVQERKYVAGLVRSSDAIVIPIDAPALMEGDVWHHERNLPDLVYNLLQIAYADLAAPRLVILAPLRCERYMKEATNRAKVVSRVQAGYAKLLRFLAYGPLQNRVAVVVTPIQTTGQIEFVDSVSRLRYQPRYAKLSPNACYAPEDAEQPLRYLLRFVLRVCQEQASTPYGRFLKLVLGGDQHLISAAARFSAGCKSSDGFAVIQGENWLTMR